MTLKKRTRVRPGRMKKTSLPAEVLADLARSGLNAADARALHIKALTPAQVSTMTKGRSNGRAAYELPYFELDGEVNGFSRLRFTGELGDGEQRYWQPPKTQPHMYFPPWADWRRMATDAAEPLYLVEGEKKAAAGCKLTGLAVAGLGGVWSWGSRKSGLTVVPDLLPFLSKGRRVVIVFDTEPRENLDVAAARDALAQEVWRHGGDPRVLQLPALDGQSKVGLDDFLVARGPKAFLALEPLPTEYAAQLAELNAELCYVTAQHAIYCMHTRSIFSRPQQLTQLAYAHRRVVVYDRGGQASERNLVTEWLAWPGRRSHAAIAYEPAGPAVTPDNRLNVWPGWGATPSRGPVTLFRELVDRLFDGSPADERRWFLQWLAYPLRHPGAKLATAAVLFSRDHGTGKSLLGYHVGRIYGDNFAVLNAEALHSQFNTWARHRQFILGEELTGSERRADAERLKLLVTQETVTINAKFQPAYDLPDRCNYLLTTNHADALNVDVYDRRFFVHEITSDKLPASFFRAYDEWYRGAGAGALHAHLLGLDLDGFEPRGPAPMTSAKGEMQRLSDLPVDFLVREMLESPGRFLEVGGSAVSRDLFTPRELTVLLDPDGRRRLNEQAMAKALRRAGVRQLEPTRVASGTVRLYAVRNAARWTGASHKERAAHYDGASLHQ